MRQAQWWGAVAATVAVLGARGPGGLGWAAACAAVAVGAASGWALQRAAPSMLPGEPQVYVALSLLAAAACVPETGRIAVAMTVSLVAVVFALALPGLPPWWVVGPWVLAFTVALAGAAARPSAVLGVLVAFAAPVVVGVVPAPLGWRVGVAGVSFVSAAVMARTGGVIVGDAVARPAAVALACWAIPLLFAVAVSVARRERRGLPRTGGGAVPPG